MKNILTVLTAVIFAFGLTFVPANVTAQSSTTKTIGETVKAATDAAPVKTEDRVPKRAAKRQTSDDYHKFEVSAGYSQMFADGILGDGEVFADSETEKLVTPDPTTFNTVGGSQNLLTNPQNVFPASPLINSGERHRPRMNGVNAAAVYNLSKYIGVKVEVSGHYRSGTANFPFLVTSAPFSALTLAECVARGRQIINFSTDPCGGDLLPLAPSYSGFFVIRAVILTAEGSSETSQRHYNFLGGLQLKNNSKEKRFKPFAHALAGASRQTIELKDFDESDLRIYGTNKFTNTGLAMSFGGGIDIRLSRRLDLRVIQVDYNPVKIKEQQIIAFKQPIFLGIPNNLTFANTATAPVFSNNDVRINSRWQNNFRIGVGIVFH